MDAPTHRNQFDRLGRLRRLTTPLEVAQIERFGTSALAALFRTEVLVLQTTGRRSGRERRTPLACTPDPQPDGSMSSLHPAPERDLFDRGRRTPTPSLQGRPDQGSHGRDPRPPDPDDPGAADEFDACADTIAAGAPGRGAPASKPGALLVVGGAGGQARTPDWVANLRAEPRATITHRRRRLAVVAHELVGDERAVRWARLTETWPRITTYERRAGHPIPVFRLVPSHPGT